MRSKAYKTLILFILATVHTANAQNKVSGLINIEDESFSKDEVFIYDGNNKFLTTSNKDGYYEFLTDKEEMNIVFLLVGSQYIQKEIKISKETELNITFEKETRVLSEVVIKGCLLYTSPSPRDRSISRMPSSA